MRESTARSTAAASGSGAGLPRSTRKACYQLLAELLLYPEDRDESRVRELARRVEAAPRGVREPLLGLVAAPEASDCERYLTTLELAPECPLYLGHYLFEEPRTCRGAATGGRNRYMLEIAGIYRHFGLETTGAEMPDYLPLVLEFLALSLDAPERNRSHVRELLVHGYVAPALTPMRARFDQAGAVWRLGIDALAALIASEPEAKGALRPAWPRRVAGAPVASESGVRGARDATYGPRNARELTVLQHGAQP